MPSSLVRLRITLATRLSVVLALLGTACHSWASSRPVTPKPDSVDVGYGTQPSSAVTVSKVNLEDSRRPTVTTMADLLQAKIPGLDVRRSGGRTTVRILGAGSPSNPGYALIVVDEMPFSDAGVLPDINPTDVTAMSVLKDASAAIYGNRGANGVILISTKRKKR